MLPAECLTHPWIAQQRAKAMVDANLEKPAEGAPIDNRQMRGYNAKRKFRVSLPYYYLAMFYTLQCTFPAYL